MRGKPSGVDGAGTISGITPADAGKTTEDKAHEHSNQDHPRGCGENRHFDSGLAAEVGSPPRMRGKHIFCLPSEKELRITPADAGKTAVDAAQSQNATDHPRGCGENNRPPLLLALVGGSPPRMREKPLIPFRYSRPCGITPADAGKTTCRTWWT